MTTGKTGIYHWKLGDISRARICKKVYANVQVVKNDEGLFYDDKVLGISANEDGSITVTEELCYYVETCKTKNRFWLPYTCMFLAERSRPFYGPAYKTPKATTPVPKTPAAPRKRKIKEDLTVPLNVKLNPNREPDLNTTYDVIHTPLKQGRYENAFKEFIRRGKESLFDQYYEYLQRDIDTNRDSLDYLMNVDASTEDKFEMVIKNIVSEKEMENYLHQCWRYNFVHKQMDSNRDNSDSSNSTSPVKPVITLHTPWCLVCGKGERLRECPNCPSAFHLACRREWLVTIIHRKNPPKKANKPVTLVEKILSSTRTICSVRKEKENTELCPSCMWGPRVGYDDVVWHKLGPCPWWPARVLTPGSTPSCLLARNHSPHHWPLKYYGTLNHSWGESSRMSLFLPAHARVAPRDDTLAQAILDACDDYIAVYLT
uniref:PWWP domain-containing protein n=1 Tax=Heliothis virescens TaxID=7102 RepID=A0A2A4JUF3_HELVI